MVMKEIALSENKTQEHFSKIASKYKTLRTTDLELILHIKNKLNGKSRIFYFNISKVIA
jgi:hypothetical protein